MIMELVMWLQENTKDFLCSDNISTASKSASGNLCADKTVILLKIDHMRSKNRYIKTITRWVQELNLSGRLFFVSSLIFLLLAGKDSDVREYLRRHKTCNVDVDSSGKPCKERMMNVLVQEQAPSKLRISDFDKEECISTIQLTERFMELQLGDVFKEYIKPLL